MTRLGKPWLGTAIVAVVALGACQAGAPSAGGAEGVTQSAAPKAVAVGKEVEAPEVFSLTETGLWDGRPSLGGTWVAHADVTDPERVVIRNAANGKSITGALFRRERANPGPSLQVSSDAAEALGMLAGQPVELSVVALRKQEVSLPPPAATPDAAEGTETLADGTAAADTATAAAVVAAGAPAEAAPKKSGGLFGFLRKKPAPAEVAAATAAEDVPADTAPDTAEAAAGAAVAIDTPVAETAAAPAVVAEPAPAPQKKRGLFGFLKKKPKVETAAGGPLDTRAVSGPIEQNTLDPLTGAAAAAIDRADARDVPAAASQPMLQRGYIQIATFTAEANASTAADKVRSAGLTATVIPEQGSEKPYWRVLVGPAASVAERDALLSRVKGIGFADAYPVTQ